MSKSTESSRAATETAGALVPEGPLREALRLAVRVLDLVERRQQPAEMSQALGQVGRCYQALGDWASAEAYLGQALRWARALGAADRSVELLCDLAEVACAAGLPPEDESGVDDGADAAAAHAALERARDHAFEASSLACLAADPHWEIKVLLRISDVLDRCGDHEDAITLQTRALTLMSQQSSSFGALEFVTDTPRAETPATLM